MSKDEIRRGQVQGIARLVDMGIEIQTIATMLRVSRPTIYRWLGGFFLPGKNESYKIDRLLDRTIEIKKDWTDIVTSWNGKYHRSTIKTLYRKAARMTLRSDLELAEKIEKLTAMTMNLWVKEGAK